MILIYIENTFIEFSWLQGFQKGIICIILQRVGGPLGPNVMNMIRMLSAVGGCDYLHGH